MVLEVSLNTGWSDFGDKIWRFFRKGAVRGVVESTSARNFSEAPN